jgi:hypothetical protein
MARAPKEALIAIPSTLSFVTPAWALGYAVTSIDTWPQDNDRGGRDSSKQRRDRSLRRFIAIELAGAKASVGAVLTALRTGRAVTVMPSAGWITRGDMITARWAPGDIAVFQAPLPGGFTHAVALHPQALPERIDPRLPAFAIAPALADRRAPTPDLSQLHRVLDALLDIPVHPDWTAPLLRLAASKELATALSNMDTDETRHARGLWAVELAPDHDRWAQLISEGVANGVLRCAS